MSRLDSAIRRLTAQRVCLDHAADLVGNRPGIVLEFGLGNGRTYDHLRTCLRNRDIYVFERALAAHPDCLPNADRLFEGDFFATLPGAITRLGAAAALAHCDIGSGDKAESRDRAERLGQAIKPLLAPGAVVVSDQDMATAGWSALALPARVESGRYYMYRAG